MGVAPVHKLQMKQQVYIYRIIFWSKLLGFSIGYEYTITAKQCKASFDKPDDNAKSKLSN